MNYLINQQVSSDVMNNLVNSNIDHVRLLPYYIEWVEHEDQGSSIVLSNNFVPLDDHVQLPLPFHWASQLQDASLLMSHQYPCH